MNRSCISTCSLNGVVPSTLCHVSCHGRPLGHATTFKQQARVCEEDVLSCLLSSFAVLTQLKEINVPNFGEPESGR